MSKSYVRLLTTHDTDSGGKDMTQEAINVAEQARRRANVRAKIQKTLKFYFMTLEHKTSQKLTFAFVNGIDTSMPVTMNNVVDPIQTLFTYLTNDNSLFTIHAMDRDNHVILHDDELDELAPSEILNRFIEHSEMTEANSVSLQATIERQFIDVADPDEGEIVNYQNLSLLTLCELN